MIFACEFCGGELEPMLPYILAGIVLALTVLKGKLRRFAFRGRSKVENNEQ